MENTTGFGSKCTAWLNLPDEAVFQRGVHASHPPLPSQREALEKIYGKEAILPIEFFKIYPDELETFFKPTRSFLSSGTTAKDRSRSSFSAEGLELYRQFSLKAFRAMLSRFFPGKAPGWSMIPPVKEWPTSSLAQMIAWIGEEFPLSYWENEGQGAGPSGNEPVWVFATGFHIVAFADSGKTCPLPPGSVVIETGGTKGKTRSVSREESYDLIEKCFNVPRNRIVSEYGMCELASQAYDFLDHPDGPRTELRDRFFRFPQWVAPKVLRVDQKTATEGRGSLIVEDALRVDLPWPIRSEDAVKLSADGRFQLEGRVLFSPLKGCSMMAEELLKAGEKKSASKAKVQLLNPWTISRERAERVHKRAWTMVQDPAFRQLLEQEMKSVLLAKWALQDLVNSLPASIEDWISAGNIALGNNSVKKWIFIPPETHSFTLFHPLFIGALLDLDIKVRDQKSPATMNYLTELFHGLWSFKRLPKSWRFPSAEPTDAVLAYGSNETLAALREATDRPVQGFGSYLTFDLIHASSWKNDRAIRDAFSLRQRGCMSSRLLFVWGATDKLPPLTSAPVGPLPYEDQLQLCHSELGMGLLQFEVLPRPTPDYPVIAEKDWSVDEPIENLLSPRPFTLPILKLTADQLPKLLEKLAEIPDLKKLAVDPETNQKLGTYAKRWEICKVGEANQTVWDGRHEGRSLFGISLKREL